MPEFRTDLRSDPREHLSLEGRRARREINRRRIRMRRFTVLAAKLGLPLLAVLFAQRHRAMARVYPPQRPDPHVVPPGLLARGGERAA